MTEPLLPCPFCGATEPDVQVMWESDYAMVGCDKCGCAALMDVRKAEAVAAWNHRTPLPPEVRAALADLCSLAGFIEAYAPARIVRAWLAAQP